MTKGTEYRLPAALIMLLVLLLTSLQGRGVPSDEVDATVRHLIDHVARSGLVFVRNNEEYTSQEAAEHMAKKYRHFMDGIETTEDFIQRCATKSLLTGKLYFVIDGGGLRLKTADWLNTELAAYRSRTQ